VVGATLADGHYLDGQLLWVIFTIYFHVSANNDRITTRRSAKESLKWGEFDPLVQRYDQSRTSMMEEITTERGRGGKLIINV
jgi:hypothetical protein